jgi:carboxymethylenebutenolidase
MARTEEVSVDGGRMKVFVDEPGGAGPHPALVVAHHRGGNDAFTAKFAMDLAASGYVAAAPNLYHRRPEGEDTGVSVTKLDDIETLADLRAALAFLQAQPKVDKNRIGIVGHCMGGRYSFLGASSDKAFKACVVYYGGNMFATRGRSDTTPFQLLKNLACPVLGFFGNDDQNPSPEDVAKIAAELDAHRIAREFHAYDGCGHAFQNFLNPAAYRPAATRESWDKMIAWLARNL